MSNTKVSENINNIVYVEPNYLNSMEIVDVNGLNTYEFAPPLEDYCIYVNLEVETRGREIQSSKSSGNNKLIMSYISTTDGKSVVNFLQGSKIPIGENGVTMNSLTTNYTDIFIKDLKNLGPSTEMFGIQSIDIAYNNYMVPEVTIEFIDVRGVALFAQKEYYETNKNIDKAINSQNQADIANTFFQCFFTFPYPKFSLMVKGFYGNPVSYELTCADFRARFDSNTGHFACTAKFVGYYFSFLNDVMINGVVAAPYSDYIGADYWERREFKLKGLTGGDLPIPKIGDLLNKMKEIETKAQRIAQSDPVNQEKVAAEKKSGELTDVENAYNAFSNTIREFIKEPLQKYQGEDAYTNITTNNGALKSLVLLSPTENVRRFDVYVGDRTGQISGKYEALVKAIEKYNSSNPNNQLPKPDSFYDSTPLLRIAKASNDDNKAFPAEYNNKDISERYINLYNKFKINVNNGNKPGIKNPLLDYRKGYFYDDNNFVNLFEKYKGEVSEKEKDINQRMEKVIDDSINQALGFIPTVENITKIVMAHLETFAYMLFETARTITNENPQRTLSSLQVSDSRDMSDVKDPEAKVPPFPKVTKEINRDNSVIREEAWVGDYAGDFREKDLVHGIINGIREVSKDALNYMNQETGSSGDSGSDGRKKSIMRYPLCPIDLTANSRTYSANGFDQNDLSSFLSLVGMRAIQILGTTNFSDWGNNAKTLGIAEANNFLAEHKLSKELKQKLSSDGLTADSVMQMLKGNTGGEIKKPGDGSKPWPWRVDANNNGGVIDENGNLIICKTKGNYFSVPYQNLSWTKIKNDIINSPEGSRAVNSNDYINTYYKVAKDNVFSYDTNVNRFSEIVETQLTGIDGIDFYQKKFLDECKYDSSKYSGLMTSNAKKVIAYIIENAATMIPTEGSCMLPTQKEAFASESFGGGYDMDDFYKEKPGKGGDGWKDKDGNEVKRIADNGYDNYLNELNARTFTFTEFPGVKNNLEPYKDVSIFAEMLYYEQVDVKSKALLFLASLGYAFDYNKIIKEYICKKDVTMIVMPLPALLFAGALIWANTPEGGRKAVNYKLGYYADAVEQLKTLKDDVRKKLQTNFEKWVTSGIKGNSMLKSFEAIRTGMELDFLKRSAADFFQKFGEIEDRGILWFGGNGWLSRYSNDYKNVMDFFKNELGDSFFRNYIVVDEDAGGNTAERTRGMRLGNRDGGPSTIFACDIALAGCVFVKNSKYFNDKQTTSVSVNPGSLTSFFEGFLSRVKEEKVEESNVDSQISQAADPNDSNTDIKIGIYRYCKMLYDKWIAGLTDQQFRDMWTMEAFFEDEDKYFHFIDAYYNLSEFIPTNIARFCDEIVSCWTNEQYSLLAFLSTIYSQNRFNFLCIQNFMDLSKRENMERMFDTVAITETFETARHPNFIVMYPYESSNYLADMEDSEYTNDGFMINMPESTENKWPEPLKSSNLSKANKYTIPAFGVSYGKLYQSYFRDIDISMDNPTVTEQSIKAQFAIACQNNEKEQTGDRSKMYAYGQDLYSIYSNNSYTCNVTMMGCAWVQPLMYFVLNNVPMFRGTYLIEKVMHHIEPGNMITKFMGVRMSNVCTRIARDCSVRERLEQTGEGQTNDNTVEIENNLASVDNFCPYKEFPLDSNSTATGSGGATPTNVNLSGSEKQKAMSVMKALMSMGFNATAAAGIAGNISDESGFNPKALIVDNNGCKSGGICQWNSGLLCDLVGNKKPGTTVKDACQKSKSIVASQLPDINKQLSFLYQDVTTNYKKIPNYNKKFGYPYWKQFVGGNLMNIVNNASSPADAAKKFAAVYERCSKCMQGLPDNDKRMKNATAFFTEYNKNTSSNKVANNKDNHVSELSFAFYNALRQSCDAANLGVNLGIDTDRSKGNIVYLTNGTPKSNKFADVFDVILQAYSDKVDSVKWVMPNKNSYSSVPVEYIVSVKEGSNLSDIMVTSANGEKITEYLPISKKGETSGMHDSYCKALVKKYKSNTRELQTDTHHQLSDDDYAALFSENRYHIKECNEVMQNAGYSNGNPESTESTENRGGKENASEFIGNWNVGKYVERLHYWQKNVCETLKVPRENKPGYKGCHRCTAAINRALEDSGMGRKYWGGEPWNVYDSMKKSNSDFIEVTGGTSSSKHEFNFGGKPHKGDICVMWKTGRNKPRHTCSFDGSKWYSDVEQNMCNVYTGSGEFNIEWHLFRHK